MSLSGLLVHQFGENSGFKWLNPILQTLNDILWPILIVVGAVGTIYAIYLGVMMAKAENAEKREEAKKRIINAVIAIVVMCVLILLLQLFVNNAPSILGSGVQDSKDNTDTETVIGLLNLLR